MEDQSIEKKKIQDGVYTVGIYKTSTGNNGLIFNLFTGNETIDVVGGEPPIQIIINHEDRRTGEIIKGIAVLDRNFSKQVGHLAYRYDPKGESENVIKMAELTPLNMDLL